MGLATDRECLARVHQAVAARELKDRVASQQARAEKRAADETRKQKELGEVADEVAGIDPGEIAGLSDIDIVEEALGKVSTHQLFPLALGEYLVKAGYATPQARRRRAPGR